MTQIRNQLENKSRDWTENARFRVGDTVKYEDYSWSNVTGANGEPGVSNDWYRGIYVGLGNPGLKKWTEIDGFLVDKGNRSDRNAIEPLDTFMGNYTFPDGSVEFVIATAISLPYTDPSKINIKFGSL